MTAAENSLIPDEYRHLAEPPAAGYVSRPTVLRIREMGHVTMAGRVTEQARHVLRGEE